MRYIFKLSKAASLEITISNEHNAGTLCDLYYANNKTEQTIHLSNSTIIDLLTTFQGLSEEMNNGDRSILPSLFEKGIGYYYLLDCFLIDHGHKLPCHWTKYLENLGISLHKNFLWLYTFDGKSYYEVSYGINFGNQENEIILPVPLEGVLLRREEISDSAIQKMAEQALEVKNTL